MLKSYFKVAFRSLRKNKLISFINVFGLGLSMTVGMMVMIRLQDQLSYDKFHPKPEKTYRITSEYNKNTGEHWRMASTPLPLMNKLSGFTGLDNFVNLYPALNGKAVAAGKELYINGAFTEASFFKVFGFTLSSGNADALQKPNAIIISKETAKRFFGNESALGKIFTMESGRSYIVSGVMEESPGKSHIRYDAYVSIDAVPQLEKDKILAERSTDWFAFNAGYTYIVVKDGYALKNIRSQLNAVAAALNKENKEGLAAFSLQPISKITPGSDLLYNDIGGGSSWAKFYFEMGVALLILLAACFNYTNLTIARALTRAKEVGVRKINGANRAQIFVQYIIESVMLALLALCFAWVLLSLIVQYAPFNDGYEFIPSAFRFNNGFVTATVLFALFTGLLAGVSPAWILSSFKPLRVLKNLTTAKILGKVSLQKTLIVFQYSLSLTIIIFLLAFYKQFAHLSAVDPGFKRDNVLVVPLNGLDEKIVEQKIMATAGVRSVSAMSGSFNNRFNGMSFQVWVNNKKDALPLKYYYAEPSFIKNMNLQIVAGRNVDETEISKEQYLLVNEQTVKALGIKNNDDALGKKIWINDSSKLEIAGVLKDFAYENAGAGIMPLALRSRKNAYGYLYITTSGSDKQRTSEQVIALMKVAAPSQTFDAGWLDEQLAKGNSQTATISLLGYLAFMAVAIASLGLLGLVIYTVQVKRKEISIRKIIGAENKQLVQLLSRGFIKLLFIAGLIAMPLGYTAAILFLQNFANRVQFTLVNAILCFLLLLTIGLVTIISQTYKAAAANPVKDLRRE